jgi:hypothetical protein
MTVRTTTNLSFVIDRPETQSRFSRHSPDSETFFRPAGARCNEIRLAADCASGRDLDRRRQYPPNVWYGLSGASAKWSETFANLAR